MTALQKATFSPHVRGIFSGKVLQSVNSSTKNGVRNIASTHVQSSSTANDYIQESRVPTYHFQKSMPHLPIPELESTCSRYLAAQKPLLTPDQYERTASITSEFQSGDGKALNDELVAKDKQNKNTSYITGPWFDMYLKARDPVVLNFNPYMTFTNDPKPEYNNQLIRATNMIVSSMRFMKTLRAEKLEPEVYHLNPAKSDTGSFRSFVRWLPQSVSWYGAYLYKAYPLDMSQFKNLFNSTRIPRLNKDELYKDDSASHLLVIRNGRMYTFDVLDTSGRVKPATEVMRSLKYILSRDDPPPEFSLGALTAENRDVWAGVREQLVASGNQEQLHLVDSAAFAFILDDESPSSPDEMSRQFLHGKAANRWFDKSFSLILAKDGEACVNFEHAWGDGVAVLRYFNEVFKESTQNPFVHPDTEPANIDPSVKEIQFNLSDTTKNAIKEAEKNFSEFTGQVKYSHTMMEEYGKNFVKKQKLSSDAIMQLAFQIAYHRMYDGTAATYESCSTAAFKHGRTETIRSCTSATKEASLMFDRTTERPSVSELMAAFSKCSEHHGKLTKEAAMGKGFDRHLFGIKHLAEETGRELPALFTDPAYQQLNTVILSTSTLSSPAVQIGGFAPVSKDGFGLGYGVDDNALGCNVTSYQSRDVEAFVACINRTLLDMYSIMNGTDFK